MRPFIVNNSRASLLFGACFLVGVAFASLCATRAWLPFTLAVCFLGIFLLIVGRFDRFQKIVVISVVASALGALRFVVALPTTSPERLVAYADRKLQLEGVVREEPDRRIAGAQYVVLVDQFVGSAQKIRGKILVKLPLYPEYTYGDRLRLMCKVTLPEPTKEGFRYDQYLAAQGIDAVCEQPQVTLLDHRQGSWLFTQLLRFKMFIAETISRVWNEPKSSFMAGILYGSRSGLPPELTDLFNKTGVTHIIAVSGSNISIIAVAVMSTLVASGLHRRRATYVVGGFIVVFVVFTGASASVVRAGIMGGIALLGKLVGRPVRMSIVLMTTAVAMTLLNPYVLIWDAGFQLSFLSTMGLIYISPLVMEKVLQKSMPAVFAVLIENGVTTISAILATLPLMLFQFGRLSLVAPIVNVLILWTIPYVMLFGFIATIVGMISSTLGIITAVPSVALMEYILQVVGWFGAQSFASLDIAVPWWGMVGLYCLLIYGVLRSSRLRTQF